MTQNEELVATLVRAYRELSPDVLEATEGTYDLQKALEALAVAQEPSPPPPCNLCGEPCGERDTSMGLVNKTITGGYESTPGNGNGALDDCTEYTFSLCEFCLDWLFSKFKTPPQVGRYGDDEEVFRPAEQRVNEDEWRRHKETFFAEFNKRNAARKP